jgi:putative isomerase
MSNLEKYIDLIKNYSKKSYLKLTREPMKLLKYPFIVPGAVYTYQLWDWDSWLTDVAVRQIISDNGGAGERDFLECERGCILNFLDHADLDGKIPVVIDGYHPLPFMVTAKNGHKPCLAQHLALF